MNAAAVAQKLFVQVAAPVEGAPFHVGDTLIIDRLCNKQSPWVMIEYADQQHVIAANSAVRRWLADIIVGEVVAYQEPGRSLV
ncbi:hypothetical protein ASG35_03100 [Burkholderia sp. Leaf177]|uniref:hypothetical protein n=1 Tax=Burkholderia sp. Leaf177 TaxID=1736287 RepID=UPI000701555B|nr:hypothetical protein [Burkholderia sp. Leaf177]KQR90212.1 hypothetical protein ASG35_03100 [Burkholderia sp. Leaf177]